MKQDEQLKRHNELINKKTQAEAQLLALPGVKGVGIGYKIVAGKRTEETYIVVFVEKKHPKKTMKNNDIVPTEIHGVITDVQEIPVVTKDLLKVSEKVELYNTAKTRPLEGGTQIENSKNEHIGTLGCIACKNDGGDYVVLSNHHVLYSDGASDGDKYGQPDVSDSSCSSCQSTVGTLITGTKNTTVDCAIGTIDDYTSSLGKSGNLKKGVGNKIIHEDPIEGTTSAILGETVRKTGIRTDTTKGKIVCIDSVVLCEGKCKTDQITVEPDSGHFSNEGDSGAVVINDDNKVVGLNYASDKDGELYAFSNKIENVLNNLDIEIPKTIKVSDATLKSRAAASELGTEENKNNSSWGKLWAQYKADLNQSPMGKNYVNVIDANWKQVIELVHHDKPTMRVWLKNKGPGFIKKAQQSGFDGNPNAKLPTEVDGVTAQEFLSNMTVVLHQRGKSPLPEDIEDNTVNVLELENSGCKDIKCLLNFIKKQKASYTHKRFSGTMASFMELFSLQIKGVSLPSIDNIDVGMPVPDGCGFSHQTSGDAEIGLSNMVMDGIDVKPEGFHIDHVDSHITKVHVDANNSGSLTIPEGIWTCTQGCQGCPDSKFKGTFTTNISSASITIYVTIDFHWKFLKYHFDCTSIRIKLGSISTTVKGDYDPSILQWINTVVNSKTVTDKLKDEVTPKIEDAAKKAANKYLRKHWDGK